ncbi:MAG: penicillin-binding protein activator [Gammaproteobacteria bacterium]|nr:penicillin-binding protein activator [Gammaproteobacteria bacterium]
MRLLLRLAPLILLLAGCATGPTGPREGVAPDAAPAYRALDAGNYQRAASLFERLAGESQPPQRQDYRISAVEALLRADLIPQAAQLLARIDPVGMDARGHARMQLAEARIALKRRDAEDALAILAGQHTPSSEPELLADYHQLRGLAYQQLGNHLEAAREWVMREPFLARTEAVLANQRAIWDSLTQLSAPVLLALQTAPPDVLSGWMDLVRIGKSLHTAPQLQAQLANWQRLFPQHPVQDVLLQELRLRSQESMAPPTKIAVLLPFTGDFAGAAAAVRDGVLAAHYADPNRVGIVLRSYDTGGNAGQANAAYEQAMADGAEFIIGPLTKEAVDAIASRWSLPIPTMALNVGERRGPDNFYQFGLVPEDEAEQVAERAWIDGMTRAAIVAPTGPWGSRLAEAFESRWREFGGEVVAMASYDAQKNDFSGPLRQLLAVDASDRRHRQLAATLGQRLEFTPRRRQDVDFVFMAGFPRQVRLLKPQLNFHHATDLPVYSTSHLFSGTVTPHLDRDMDGVVFGDMPWVLEGLQPAALKQHDGQMRRLVALGSDAYKVIPYLRLLKRYPEERFEGGTGTLRMDGDNRLRRSIAWARFNAGRPRALVETTPDSAGR